MPDLSRQPAAAYVAAGTGVFYLGGVADVSYTGPVDFMTTCGGGPTVAHAPSAAHATDAIAQLDAGGAPRGWAVWPCGSSPAQHVPVSDCGTGGGEGGGRG